VVALEAHLDLLVVGQAGPLGLGLLLGKVDLLVPIPDLVATAIPLATATALLGIGLNGTRLLLVLSLLLASRSVAALPTTLTARRKLSRILV